MIPTVASLAPGTTVYHSHGTAYTFLGFACDQTQTNGVGPAHGAAVLQSQAKDGDFKGNIYLLPREIFEDVYSLSRKVTKNTLSPGRNFVYTNGGRHPYNFTGKLENSDQYVAYDPQDGEYFLLSTEDFFSGKYTWVDND